MDNTDKKILEYLSEKDKASEVSVINETFTEFGISKEEYVGHLKTLQNKGYIRYERPYGNGAFVYITEEGRWFIKESSQKVFGYIRKHLLELFILLLTALSLWVMLNNG